MVVVETIEFLFLLFLIRSFNLYFLFCFTRIMLLLVFSKAFGAAHLDLALGRLCGGCSRGSDRVSCLGFSILCGVSGAK